MCIRCCRKIRENGWNKEKEDRLDRIAEGSGGLFSLLRLTVGGGEINPNNYI